MFVFIPGSISPVTYLPNGADIWREMSKQNGAKRTLRGLPLLIYLSMPKTPNQH